MRRYRWLWWTTLLAVAVPAILLGLVSAPIAAVVVSVSVVGVLVGLVLLGSDLSWRDWTDTAAASGARGGRRAGARARHPLLLLLAAATSPPDGAAGPPPHPGEVGGRDGGRALGHPADVLSCWSG